MSNRAQIAELLHGLPAVTCINKKTYEINSLKTPVTLRLEKQGIKLSLGRTVDYRDAPSYLRGLLKTTVNSIVWDEETWESSFNTLISLYSDRVVKKLKKSFYLDSITDPSIVELKKDGSVKITWSGAGQVNVYRFEDCVKNLTEYGNAFIANADFTAQATAEEIERDPRILKRLGPAFPQPHHISNESMNAAIALQKSEPIMSDKKQYWHHVPSNSLVVTNPGEDIREVSEHCVELDKADYKHLKKKGGATKIEKFTPPPPAEKRRKTRKKKASSKPDTSGTSDTTKDKPPKERAKKPKAPRGSKLGEGGKPLDKKQIKEATQAVASISQQGKAVRMLITEYDADNDSINDILGCEDKVVQRIRRAMRREQAKNGE